MASGGGDPKPSLKGQMGGDKGEKGLPDQRVCGRHRRPGEHGRPGPGEELSLR